MPHASTLSQNATPPSLAGNPAWPEFLSDVLACDTVTLLYSARDEQHNNAAVLAKMIEKEQPGGK